ncbi:MAG: exosortase system-associated protein, TIGR04073 family [Verrucomicrobiaceae bacterium]|nr:exosortase system-associated protein, TIGR04073 family [Verrucomicrobiaceae bacterium]
MKKRITFSLLLALLVSGAAFADIQSSPGMRWNWSRKLARAIANIAYSPAEVLSTLSRTNGDNGNVASGSEGVIEGSKRTVVRLGYGIYELITFPVHAYKGTYRPPFYRKADMDPWFGYDEFPPQIGIHSQATYSRTQVW